MSSGDGKRWARSAAFVKARKADPAFEAHAEGALVWVPGQDHIFLPAKVKSAAGLERGAAGGQVLMRLGGKVRTVDLSEEDAAQVLPMGEANLSCLGTISYSVPDLSEPALFHNLRLRFVRGHHFMLLGGNVLFFLNQFFQTDMLTLATLSDRSHITRRPSRFLDAAATRSAVLEEADLADERGGTDDAADEEEEASEACRESLGTLVSRSFARLCDSKGVRSQSIVVMGATAAGKRDVTKFILLRAIQLARPTNAEWWKKLLAADTLLQAFGGEAFVRWTEIKMLFPRARPGAAQSVMSVLTGDGGGDFLEPQLLGAVYNSFGLDHARVTDPDQETFPVFYALLEASYLMDARLRDALDVGPPHRYRYLGDAAERPAARNCSTLTCSKPAYGLSGKCEGHAPRCEDEDCEEPQLGDGFCLEHGPSAAHRSAHPAEAARAWHAASGAMAALGLNGKRRDDVVRILVGLLDIGNVDFWENPKQDPNEEPLTDSEDEAGEARQSARLPASLLGVTTRQLRKAFKVKTLRVKGETFRKVRPMREKYAVRDGVARVVYGALFSWLLAKINAEVSTISDVLQKQAEAIEALEKQLRAADPSSDAPAADAALPVDSAANDDDDEVDSDSDHAAAAAPAAGLFAAGSFFSRLAGAVGAAAAAPAPPASPAGGSKPKRKKERALQHADSATARRQKHKAAAAKTQHNALGNTGVLGVLENASLQLGASSLEDLFHNYRLERLHAFFAENLSGRVAGRLQRRHGLAPPPHALPGAAAVARGSCLSLLMRPVSNAGRGGNARSSVRRSGELAKGKVSDLLKRFSGGNRGRAGSTTAGNGSSSNNNGAAEGAQQLGVLQLIEEEVISPGSSDQSLGAKIARLAAHNTHLAEAHSTAFQVRHFGGAVPYNLQGFMGRMRSNTIPLEVRKLLVERSSIGLLREVLRADADRGLFASAADDFEMTADLDAHARTARADSRASDAAGDRFVRLEATRKLQAEMDRALAILGHTEVSFVVTLGANPECDPESDVDAAFLLAQLRRTGVSDAVCSRLYDELRGAGRPLDDFVTRYAPLRVPRAVGVGPPLPSKPSGKPAKQQQQQQRRREASALLEDLVGAGLVRGRSAVAGEQPGGRAFVTASSHFALETARTLVVNEAAAIMQAAARGYILRAAIRRHGRAARLA